MAMRAGPPNRFGALATLFALSFGLTTSAATPALALAQSYPTRPVRIVVADSGTQSDVMARALAPLVAKTLGQPVVVENYGGAGGTIAAQRVVQARADGYTLLIGGVNNIVLASLLRPDLAYAPATDLVPLGGIARVPYAIAVGSHIDAKNLSEFIAYARARPGKLSYASSGAGSSSQLALELLKFRAGLDLLHVPYRNTVAAIPDLLSGRIDVLAGDLSSMLPLAKRGAIRIIAAAGAKRASAMPELPTVAEQGLPGYAIEPWYGLFAPAGVPPDVADAVSSALAESLHTPDLRQQFAAQGYEPLEISGEALRALAALETTKYQTLIEVSGLRNTQ